MVRPTLQVIVADNGPVETAIPLRRQDERSLLNRLDYFSVSPSGEQWWVVRQPYEDWKTPEVDPVKRPNAILSVHDRTGRAQQEWRLSWRGGMDMISLQAVGEGNACVVDGQFRAWLYSRGKSAPVRTHGSSRG